MMKRSGNEMPNSSKRVKIDNDMPPPRCVPSTNLNLNIKPQASVKDPKTANNFIDDDSDDEELWIRASQIEQQVLQNNYSQISYSDFRTSSQQPLTSTQVIDLTRDSAPVMRPDQKVQILQNKCAALQKQLKKYRPTSAEMSQRANEMSELKERIKKLSNENDDLRNEKLKKEVEGDDGGSLKSENEKLKQMIEKLMKEKEKSEIGNFNRNGMKNDEKSSNLVRMRNQNLIDSSFIVPSTQDQVQFNRIQSNLNRLKPIDEESSSQMQSSLSQMQPNSNYHQIQSNLSQIYPSSSQNQHNFKIPSAFNRNPAKFQRSQANFLRNLTEFSNIPTNSINSSQDQTKKHSNFINSQRNLNGNQEYCNPNPGSSRNQVNFDPNSESSRNHQNSNMTQTSLNKVQQNLKRIQENYSECQVSLKSRQNSANNYQETVNYHKTQSNFNNNQKFGYSHQNNDENPQKLINNHSNNDNNHKNKQNFHSKEQNSTQFHHNSNNLNQNNQKIGNNHQKQSNNRNFDPIDQYQSSFEPNQNRNHLNYDKNQQFDKNHPKYDKNHPIDSQNHQNDIKNRQNYNKTQSNQHETYSRQQNQQENQFKHQNEPENQLNSSYKELKLTIWDEDYENMLFTSTEDSEVVDLIDKTEDFNIFDGNCESFEEMEKKKLLKVKARVIKAENLRVFGGSSRNNSNFLPKSYQNYPKNPGKSLQYSRIDQKSLQESNNAQLSHQNSIISLKSLQNSTGSSKSLQNQKNPQQPTENHSKNHQNISKTTSEPQYNNSSPKFNQPKTRSMNNLNNIPESSRGFKILSNVNQNAAQNYENPQNLAEIVQNSSKNHQNYFKIPFQCFSELNSSISKSTYHNPSPDTSEISTLKLLITEMQSKTLKKLQTIDISNTFNEILKIFLKISSSVKEIEMRRWNEHFMKQEFACKQAQYFSEQHFADNELKILSKCDEMSLISHEKLFEDELRVEERRMVAMIAIICRNSSELSEKILTQNISTVNDDFRTVIDEICELIDPYILQSRFLYKNSGLTMALCELICSLSTHYGQFDRKNSKVDEMVTKFFNHLLTMSTNSSKILIRLTKFLINVSKNPEFGIISKFCINFPSSNLEFSKIYKIYQIPRNGCLLQIYFCLLGSSFQYTEDVNEHKIDDLIELTMKLNILVDIFMANSDKLEFLKPRGNEDSKSYCKCYKFLIVALLTVNEQVLRHRNYHGEENFYKLRRITKSAVVNITKLLSISRKTVAFWNFNFAHNLMNDINMKVKHDQIDIDEKLFVCKDVLLLRGHDDFLRRLRVKTNFQDDESSFFGCSQGDSTDLNISIKEVNDGLKKTLLEESSECFRKDDR